MENTTASLQYKITQPSYAGGYKIGKVYTTKFMIDEKPCWLHRKMMKWFFGWEWVDGSI
jgi:hypothetical protein